MELSRNAAVFSGWSAADRSAYDANMRKRYQQRRSTQQEKEETTDSFLTKLADLMAMPQRMEQAANMQMYGNENTKKLGEILDTRNQEKISNARDELAYAAERAAVGAADKLEGLVNAIGYAGQALTRTQQLQNSQDVAVWGAVTGSDTQKSLSGRLEQTALKSARDGLKDTVAFGDDYRADVERRYANSDISKSGRAAADVSEGIGGLLPSMAVNLIAPGSGVTANAVNAISAAGNAVQQAKKSGADDIRATGYGLATGGIEFAAEKVVDGLSGLFGRGALDDIIEKSVEKYLTNQTAKRVVTAAGKAFGEGAEEFISEVGGRLANEWLIDTDDRSFRETLKDGLYNAMIGTFISGAAQVGGSAVNTVRADTETRAAVDESDYAPYVEQLEQAQRNKKIRELQETYQRFLQSNGETAEAVIPTKEVDPEKQFKKILETAADGGKIELTEEMEQYIAAKPFEEIEGLRGKLTDRAARRWYLANDAKILGQIDKGASLEQQARQAFELRNLYRTQTRDLMANKRGRRQLNRKEPNKTFDQLLMHKMKDKGLTYEEALKDTIATSGKTRSLTNQKYGLE